MKMKNEHETCVTSRLTLESVPSPIGKKHPRRLFNCKISPAKVSDLWATCFITFVDLIKI